LQSSPLRIPDNTSVGNGACINACAHGIYAGEPIYPRDIERSVFPVLRWRIISSCARTLFAYEDRVRPKQRSRTD